MSTYVFMKVLESAAQRYDRGLRLLTHGRIEEIYQLVAGLAAAPGRAVLDIGCGTGGLTLACAARGAKVIGIDIDTGMLEVARAKMIPPRCGGSVEWLELGAAEIEDRFDEAAFDAVVSCLTFSELAAHEQRYVLRVVHTRLKPDGKVVIADEALPPGGAARLWHRLRRWPLVAVTYLLTQTTTRPVQHLVESVRAAGFTNVEERRLPPGDFAVVSGTRRRGGS